MPSTLAAGEAPPPSSMPAATARKAAAGDDFAWVADIRAPAEEPAAPAVPSLPAAAAAGMALAAGSCAAAGIVTLLAAFVRVTTSGHDALTVGGAARWPLAAAFGLLAAGVLLAATARAHSVRPATLVLAGLLPAAATVSGIAVVAMLAATAATGLAVARDRRRPGRGVPLIPTAPALAIAALVCLTAGLALARMADARPATRHAAPAPARSAAPTPQATTAPSPTATPPAATPTPAATRTPAATPPAATPTPAPPSSPPAAAGSPQALVAAYYAALDAHRFAAAWAVLAPAVRRSFGGFAHWRDGYAATVSSTPRRIVVSPLPGGGSAVRNVLVARDRAPCGTTTRRYAVTWRIGAASSGDLSVTSLTAVGLGRASSCS